MIFWVRNRKLKFTVFVKTLSIGLLTGGLWILLLFSACAKGNQFGYNASSQTVLPHASLFPTASLSAVPLPETVDPGPDGWWLVAQRLPQSDFGPGFAYFLVPADVRTHSLAQALRYRERIPPLCLNLGGIRAISLAPIGGYLAILCKEGNGLWVWSPSRKELSYVIIKNNMPGSDGQGPWSFSESFLWSADGSQIFAKVTGGYLAYGGYS